jgi:TNFR/NGFR cysteine-rich region
MQTVRSSSRWLPRRLVLTVLGSLALGACGGRSGLNDELGIIANDDGESGGRTSGGGAPSGGRGNGGGGRAGGGAGQDGGAPGTGAAPSDGGFPGTGGRIEPECATGTWNDGMACRPWTVCEPGQYVAYFGTPTDDTYCRPCPEHSYTESSNEVSCLYSGCELYERVLEPATPSRRAKCELDPNHLEFDPYWQLIGLTSFEEQAYAGFAGGASTLIPAFPIAAFSRSLPRTDYYDAVRAFAISPDGTLALQGESFVPTYSFWHEGYPPNVSDPWRETVPPDPYYNSGNSSGLTATDSHWVWWRLLYGPGGFMVGVGKSTYPGFTLDAPEAVLPFSSIESLAVDDQETVWMVGWQSGVTVLGRLVNGALPLETISLPGAIAGQVAVAPEGTAYVVGAEPNGLGTLYLGEIDATGSLQRTFSFRDTSLTAVRPTAIAVDPGKAVYVAASNVSVDQEAYPFSRTNILLLRFDLADGAVVRELLVGPEEETANFMTVTSDGSVYIAGGRYAAWFVKKVF